MGTAYGRVRRAALAMPSANRNAWSTAPSRSSSPPPASSLIPADNETQSCAEVRFERGISDHFLIAVVGRVLHVRVGRHVAMDGVPAAEVEARVSGSVV